MSHFVVKISNGRTQRTQSYTTVEKQILIYKIRGLPSCRV